MSRHSAAIPIKTAIFGGAFDPPHVGHQGAIRAILDSALAQHIWLTPSGDRDDKSVRAGSTHRVAMLELILRDYFADDSAVSIERCQVDGQVTGSYTIDLMRFFRGKYPQRSFSFIIGSDLISQLESWKDPDALAQEVEFLVLPRPGYSSTLASRMKLNVIPERFLVPSPASSSQARILLGQNKSTEGILAPCVASYIQKHRLYGASAGAGAT